MQTAIHKHLHAHEPDVRRVHRMTPAALSGDPVVIASEVQPVLAVPMSGGAS
jgi:hypothetical protein